jgi:hypothetical protein
MQTRSGLALIDPPAKRTSLDGAWWPRTRNLSDDLPGLVQELHPREIRVTRVTRVTYNPDGWETAPRRLAADGRTIRLGWFRSIDTQLLALTGDTNRGRLDPPRNSAGDDGGQPPSKPSLPLSTTPTGAHP